ncbi:hypothetical protein IMZ31_20920 (plasmid) [Pontibacillus sp. ALD_SL1]|uniref:Mbov_0395 family pilin-like conjugal transfer protein n=1 Tax=Pontibacillus sp. ALD_SL1 TaxID=2777185 RepID=UPI001A96EC32|nr:pilin [Pontibacillus sp. ALD_SL1]QST03012.1 hypothetical protein IMZ31_20920 [Pontibacillus sp. ALD_SL1]
MNYVMQKFMMVIMALALMVSVFSLTATNVSAACTAVVNENTGEWVTDGNGNGSWDEGEKTAATDTVITECTAAADSLSGKILRFVKIISTLVIVFAVGMIIYSGFKYITSQGDPKKSEEAKTQMWHAGVGLFIVMAAFTIMQLFLNAAGGM